MFSTITAAVNDKPADIIEKISPNSSKMIKIQVQTLLLMMNLVNFKHNEKLNTLSLH